MSIAGVMNDLNNVEAQNIIDANKPDNGSVFLRSIPYGLGTLAAAGLGTYGAVVASSTVLAVASVALALFGAYGFFVTAYIGIYSKDTADFSRRIGPALTTTAFAVVTEMIATVAKVVFINIINKALNHN
jgi:hypothetical protein